MIENEKDYTTLEARLDLLEGKNKEEVINRLYDTAFEYGFRSGKGFNAMLLFVSMIYMVLSLAYFIKNY